MKNACRIKGRGCWDPQMSTTPKLIKLYRGERIQIKMCKVTRPTLLGLQGCNILPNINKYKVATG